MQAIEINEAEKEIAKTSAKQYDSTAELHEEDQLLRYIANLKDKSVGIKDYFRGGYSCAHQVANIRNSLPEISGKPINILEFASGFGRVSRHLKKAFPNDQLISSDIHANACEFISEAMGIETVQSNYDPDQVNFNKSFDFIFVFSLFSHLPPDSFRVWLKKLYSSLEPGGYLLITTCGQTTIRKRNAFWGDKMDVNDEFCYLEQSDQLDLDTEKYGAMVVSPVFISKIIRDTIPDALIYSFKSCQWFGHQDEWIFQKPIAIA